MCCGDAFSLTLFEVGDTINDIYLLELSSEFERRNTGRVYGIFLNLTDNGEMGDSRKAYSTIMY